MKVLGLLGQKTDEGLSGLGRLWDELTGGISEKTAALRAEGEALKPQTGSLGEGTGTARDYLSPPKQTELDRLVSQRIQLLGMKGQGYSPEYASGLLKFGEEGMTQEARMARAAEQGFEGPFYRWTEGGQGRVVRTPESDKGLKFGPAGYASPQPEYGARYVDPSKANVQQLMARGPLADLNEVDRVSQSLIAQRKEAGLPQWPGHQQHWAEMQDALKAEGYRGVRYGDKEVASFEPEINMRSTSATFDPASKGGLLGGVGGATVIGGLLAGPQEAEAGAGSKILGQISDIGFFSPLERAVGGLSQQKGTGDQMLAMIQKQAGVKPEEVQWTGLGDFLTGKPSVTKGEIEDYLINNRVELQEVKLQAPAINLESPYATPEVRRILEQHQGQAPDAIQLALTNDYDAYKSLERVNPNLVNLDDWEDVVLNDVLNVQMPYQTADEWQGAIRTAEQAGDFNTAEQLTRAWEANEGLGPAGLPKFGQYTTPGGSNYRELLMTMPKQRAVQPAEYTSGWTVETVSENPYVGQRQIVIRDASGNIRGQRSGFRGTDQEAIDNTVSAMANQRTKEAEAALNFRSSHYDQPNILAHTRVKDYTQDGQKILHVEEVQSDWHQAGRKKGYFGENERKAKEISAEWKKVEDELAPLQRRLRDLEGAYNASAYSDEIASLKNKIAPLMQKNDEYKRMLDELSPNYGAVPDAPFKKNWHELMTRRILQEAADKGYSRVTFTTGRTQADRYDLGKQVEAIYYDKKHGKLTAYDHDAYQVINETVPEEKIADYIGKEAAEKLMRPEYTIKSRDHVQELSGQNLRIGGEGMKGFYDNMMVKAFNKEGKKYGVKVEPYTLKTGKNGEQVWSMEIPPEMRAKRKAEGSPMFAAAPFSLLGAGAMAPDKDAQAAMIAENIRQTPLSAFDLNAKPQAEMRAPRYGVLADIAGAFESGSRNDLLGSGESAARVANALAYGQRPGILDTIIGSFEAVDPITWTSLLGAMTKGR
jgi:hypothetical protein